MVSITRTDNHAGHSLIIMGVLHLTYAYMQLQLSKEFNTVMELGDAINNYSWSPQRFAESIPYLHKTLQQTLMRTIVAVIKKIGSEDYSVDLRNKASHELCRDIIDSELLNKSLPFV